MQHAGLIYTIAQRYLPLCDPSTDLDDLMQAGHIGLMRAEGTYRPDKGKFTTWAGYYVQQEMQAALGLRGTRIRAHRGAVSLDAPTGEDESCSLMDILPDPSADIEAMEDHAELQAVVLERVEALEKETYRELVKRCDLQGQTIAAAGAAMGLTYLSARSLREVALKKLKKDESLRALVQAHGLDQRTNWHYHRGLNAWRSDWMSTTEKLAFWRMEQEGYLQS